MYKLEPDNLKNRIDVVTPPNWVYNNTVNCNKEKKPMSKKFGK